MKEEIRLIDPPLAPGIMLVPCRPPPPRSHAGWRVFAGFVLLVSALLNTVWGILAIANDYYFTGDTLMAGYHSLWGWAYIGIAVCQVLVAFLIFVRHPVGVVLGVVILLINAVTHVLGFGGRPWWSIIAILVDLIAIFALVRYAVPPAPEPWVRPRMS